MEHRRLGRLGRMNSVLIFGGAALSAVSEIKYLSALTTPAKSGSSLTSARPLTSLASPKSSNQGSGLS